MFGSLGAQARLLAGPYRGAIAPMSSYPGRQGSVNATYHNGERCPGLMVGMAWGGSTVHGADAGC